MQNTASPIVYKESLEERRKKHTTLIVGKEFEVSYFSFLRSPKIVLKYTVSCWWIPDAGEQMKLKASFKCIIDLLWGQWYFEWVSKEKLEQEPKMQKTFPLTSLLLELCCAHRLWAGGLVRLWTIRECFWVLICGLCLGEKFVCFSFHGKLHSNRPVSILVYWAAVFLQSLSLLSNSIYFWKKDVLPGVEGKAYCSQKCCFLVRAMCSCLSSRPEKFGGKMAYIF